MPTETPPTPEPLDPKELVDRLCVYSPGIVSDLQDIVLRALQTEDDRETRLDTKAHVLLVCSSFATVVLVAAVLVRGSAATYSARIAFLAAFVLGIAAVFSALRVIFVSGDYRATNEREVLDLEQLSAADKEFLDAQQSEKEERGNVRAQGRYRRYLIAHWWQIWQRHYAVHQRKAKALRRAQILFALFLVMFAVVGVTIVIGNCPDPRSYT